MARPRQRSNSLNGLLTVVVTRMRRYIVQRRATFPNLTAARVTRFSGYSFRAWR